MTGFSVLAIGVLAIVVLLLLVMWLKVPAFVALIIVALLTGLATGIPVGDLMSVLTEGAGKTMSSVLMVVGLGAVLGRIIELSGGADAVARRFTRLMGPRRVIAGVTTASFVLGIPVFFDVGYIILAPIVFGFARTARLRPELLGLPVAGVLMVVHVIMPPHPGPVAVAGFMSVDAGLLTSVGLGVSVLAALLGYALTRWCARAGWMAVERASAGEGEGGDTGDSREGSAQRGEAATPPNPWVVMGLVVLPIVQIMVGTVGAMLAPKGSTAAGVVGLIGHPVVALLVAVALAATVVGRGQGWSWARRAEVMESALPSVAVIVFVTGAGGAFANVLVASGIGTVLSDMLVAAHLPLILTAYVVALAIRVSQGSATVAMLTAAGIIAEPVAQSGLSPWQATIVACAVGFGALAASHINDSGFWIVTKYLGLSVKDGLRTWTLASTLFSLAGFAVCAGLWWALAL
ncbi:GntP family transporter [Corynebacterium uropygiale]|uniref:GntP family transporter n=1 Tax=Corynebacterium uropygiale TaxID=1775911 RepID=A0A9X1QNZ7_9CORY|nr:GntP family transporter [Corynebacterium uropygiale]MCF4005762.1 GntP family transporter [Corynebacterium uropygiale]